MNSVRRWWVGLGVLAITWVPAAAAVTPSGSWLAAAERELVQAEYQTSVNDAGLQAPNRVQGFRTYFNAEGIRLVARSAADEPLAGVALTAYGRDGTRHDLGLAEVVPAAATVRLRWPGVVATYQNRSDGLAQELSIAQRVAGAGPLELTWQIADASAQPSAGGVRLQSASSTLRWGQIQAVDANDQTLPWVLTVVGQHIRLSVDDQQAAYPITVKSVFNGFADALLEVNQANARLGVSVAGAGDVNGDGYADVIVGANLYDGGEADEGAAFLYFGGAGVFNTGADAQLESNQINAQFGRSVAGAGDVNGDGYADVIVGANLYDFGTVDEGAAFIYFGGSGAFNTSVDAIVDADQANAGMGISVAAAGDVNGDGYGDVIVGSPGYDNGQTDEGAAFVFFGGAGAFNTSLDGQIESNQAGARLGGSVSGAGDVNADGYADVIVGALLYSNGEANEGAAFVYFGGAGVFNTVADAQLESNQLGALFGVSVAAAGDVNGDGFADVIVGAYLYDNGQTDEGAAFVYFGSAGVFNSTADAQLEANDAGASLGFSVAGGGDVNGDGFADVIVGAPAFGALDEGAALVYFGGAGSFDASPDAQLNPFQANAGMGLSVAGAGDVNGDGFADVIVGAFLYDNGQTDEGAAFVYFGGAGVFNTSANAQLESNQLQAGLGWSVAAAGDVNGDGFADVIVTAPFFDNGEVDEGVALLYFGAAGSFDTTADALLEGNQASLVLGFGGAAGAGDVNGDGYADVIVGAPGYDNGQNNEGAVFVYFGGAGAFDTGVDAVLESNQADALLGVDVAAAGDVNGDGYADIIVGAPFSPFLDGGGRAYLYFGGAGAFDTSVDAVLQPGLAGTALGGVAGAGDVNGDGYADVMVGMVDTSSDPGAAFIYFGGAGAFNTSADAQLQPAPAGASFGDSVAGVGDINGDGYADVIVGASGYDGGQLNEGAFFVYFGGAGAFNTGVDAQFESNQVDARLGSVAAAGDVNGDGYADLIVGAPGYDNGQLDEGAAWVFYGAAGGLETVADAQLEANQVGAAFGATVAGAGDVNGDGYADVIVGARAYDSGQTDEGAAFVYFGTANGRLALASQFRGDGNTPVEPWGLSQQADGFVVSIEASSARGRERGRLQVEACPNGAAFGSLLCDVLSASSWTDLGSNPLGVTLALPITGLSVDRLYHWRARVQYAALTVTAAGIVAAPKPAFGPWRRVQANAAPGDIRTSLPPPPPVLIFADGFE